MEYLSNLEVSPEEEYYFTYHFVKANLLINGFAYEAAIDLLLSYEDTHATEEERQSIAFLLGIAYNDSGNPEDAQTYLQRARAIDPDSEIGKAAGQFIR